MNDLLIDEINAPLDCPGVGVANESSLHPTRRDFIHTLAAAGLGLGLANTLGAAETRQGDVLYRTLGRTGEKVSALGLGGYHIGVPKDESLGIRIVRSAIDRGITFMDNCWDYHEGGSEIRMGKALRDGYRDKVFLMTKIDGRTREAAARQIDQCLQRLQTDRLDLLQHHEILRFEDPDRVFAKNGAMEAVVEARKAGKVRYIGFTGHKDPAVHLRMLDIAAQHQFHFDTAQMPLNVMDAHFRSFGKAVVPRLLQEGVAVLGMKPMGSGYLLKSGHVTAPECLQFALNLPASVVITGIDSLEILDQAFTVMRTFKPLDQDQVNALLAKTAQAASTGLFEPFKTDTMFDGTAQHPEWMG